MIKQLVYNDCFNIFGDPSTDEGRIEINSQMVDVISPFTFKPSGTKIIRCNKYIADDLYSALYEIYQIYGYRIHEFTGLDFYSGCHVYRQTTSGKWWSAHSWGLAVDMCYPLGEYMKPPVIPFHYVNAFLKRGFNWGGNYKTFYDGMHFSAINEG